MGLVGGGAAAVAVVGLPAMSKSNRYIYPPGSMRYRASMLEKMINPPILVKPNGDFIRYLKAHDEVVAQLGGITKCMK